MERKLYKELWQLRFQKMLRLEKESVQSYKELLEESKKKYPEHTVLRTYFERLIRDEEKHVGLVEELLHILHRQKD